MGSFGFVVPCYAGDLWMARGCLESLHYFAPQVPRCLLVDGPLKVRQDELPPGTLVVYRRDLPEDFLRDPAHGCHPKMAVFWHSPFERFMLVDADALMWGDVSWRVREGRGFVVHGDGQAMPPELIERYFFDPARVSRFYPGIEMDTRQLSNSGVFGADRGVFRMEELQQVVSLQKEQPSLFQMGEQGYLMFLIQKLRNEGRVQVRVEPLQFMAPDHPVEAAASRFALTSGGSLPPAGATGPGVQPEDAIVFHYPGAAKPWHGSRELWSAPMSLFRARAMRRRRVLRHLPAGLALRWEDYTLRKETRRSIRARINRRLQLAAERLLALVSGG